MTMFTRSLGQEQRAWTGRACRHVVRLIRVTHRTPNSIVGCGELGFRAAPMRRSGTRLNRAGSSLLRPQSLARGTSCSSTQQEFDSCSQWMLFAVFLTSRDFFSGGWEIESLRRRIDAPDSESHSATAVVASVACGEPGSGRALRVRSSNARRRIRSIHGRSTHRAVRLVQVFRSTAARHRLGHVDSAISQCRDDGVPLQRVTYS